MPTWALSLLRLYRAKKSSLVAAAIGCGCGRTLGHVLPWTILAQDGASPKERWATWSVEGSCCWVHVSLNAQPTGVGEANMGTCQRRSGGRGAGGGVLGGS
jgi:hypothetical protein